MNFKFFFIAGLLIFQAFLMQGQQSTDTIKLVGDFKTNYVYNGKKLSPKQLLTLMESNPEAHRYMKKAIGSRTVATIVGSMGGFLAGWAIGGSLGRGPYGQKNTLDKKIFYSGLGLIVLSIPINIGYPSNTFKAVRIYNQGVKESKSEK